MKYFTLQMTIVDGQTTLATFERTGIDAALSAHYSVMASATANPDCTEALSMVYDNNGFIIKNEHWVKQTTES